MVTLAVHTHTHPAFNELASLPYVSCGREREREYLLSPSYPCLSCLASSYIAYNDHRRRRRRSFAFKIVLFVVVPKSLDFPMPKVETRNSPVDFMCFVQGDFAFSANRARDEE